MCIRDSLSIELTAYPLEDEYLPVVEKYIKHLRSYKNIKIEVFPTCSVIFGKHDDVMDALWTSLEGARPSRLKSLNVEDKSNNLKKVLDWMMQ